MPSAAPRHFRTAADFRAWLEKNHDRESEILVAFYRKGTGKEGMTYLEAVDEALCWGWIDGVRRRIDEERYLNRFSPRKPKSKWSAVNVRHYARLEKEGRIAPPGAAAYARFDADAHPPYSFEARPEAFPPEMEEAFRAHAAAWDFFQAQPPGYRRTSIHWVTSARRPETRARRLARLVEASAEGKRLS